MILGVIASQAVSVSSSIPESQSLIASLFVDDDTFYAPTVFSGQQLSPSLLVDADTFYAPTVTPSAVALTPSLFTDADTFYAPIVADSSLTDDTLGLLIL